MTRIAIVIAAGLALVTTLPTVSAHAQRARVFVASYGVDSGACTFGSPCKTFQFAVSAVADGGEVTAIDSGGFQPVTINNKSVTITSPPGVEAGIAVASGAAGITINGGPNDIVSLRGLTLEGAGSGLYGIEFNSGEKLEIVDCMIRDFGYNSSASGVIVQPTGNSQLLISKTVVLNNANAGIYLTPTGSGTLNAAIDQVTADHNNYGIYIDSASTSGSPLIFSVTDSHADSNNVDGIVLNSSSVYVSTRGVVKNTTANGNSQGYGIQASGPGTITIITHSVTTMDGGGAPGVIILNNATVYSDGTNINYGDVICCVQVQSAQTY